MTNDITAELKQLHELRGMEYSKRVEEIAHLEMFNRLPDHKNIYTVGGEKSDDFQNQLIAARKAEMFGYTVYMLPNPTNPLSPRNSMNDKTILLQDGFWGGVVIVMSFSEVSREACSSRNSPFPRERFTG